MNDLKLKDIPSSYNPSSRAFTGIINEASKIFEWRHNLPKFFEEITGNIPYPYQVKFLKRMESLRNEYAIISAARGTGKTECLAILALWYVYVLPLTSPGIPMKVIILAGSERQARIAYNYILSYISKIPFLQKALAKDPTAEEILFVDGSWIRPLPASEKSVRGHHPDLLEIDEACSAKDYLLKAALPMIGTSQYPRLVLSSTPDKFFSLFVDIYSNPKNFPQFLRFNWCLDEKTEVLTNQGWKNIKTLTLDSKIATLNQQTHTLEYQKPISIFRDSYKGDMIYFNGRKLNLLVTPNHKIYSRLYNRKKWTLREAKDFLSLKAPQCRKMLKSLNWKGKTPNKIKIGPFEFNPNQFLRFLGWYLSEGSCGHYISGHKISISSHNSKFQEEIISSIKNLGFNCWNSCNRAIEMKSKSLVDYLLRFGKASEKYIPKKILNYSKDSLSILFKALMKGDGSLNTDGNYTNNRMYYDTRSKQLAEDIAEVGLKLGYSVSISQRKSTRYSKTFGNRYTVYFSKEKDVGTSKIRKVKYKGRIWCPSTKNGIILVKREGKIVWTGNSAENCPLVSKSFLKSQKGLMDQGSYIVEYLGLPYSFAGKVFPLKQLKACVKHRKLINGKGNKYAGVDWGHFPSPTVLIIAEQEIDKNGKAIWKVLHTESYLKQNFERVLDKIELIVRSYSVSNIFTDSNDIGENQRLASRGLPVFPVKFKSQKPAMISNLRALVENEKIKIDGDKDYPLVAQMRDYQYDSKGNDDYVDALMLSVKGGRTFLPRRWSLKDYILITKKRKKISGPFGIKHQMDSRYFRPREAGFEDKLDKVAEELVKKKKIFK